ncbi:MAG: alpha-L-fucosidase C-terminal domain-containing protein, partial [Candidatus Acidiferrales bacterium]
TKGDVLYAIQLAWPAHQEAVIRSLAASAATSRVDSVTLVASGAKLKFDQRPDGLHIQLPADPPGKYAFAYRITFK